MSSLLNVKKVPKSKRGKKEFNYSTNFFKFCFFWHENVMKKTIAE